MAKYMNQFMNQPFYIYERFDIEVAQAQAIFGFGGYSHNNNQFVAIDDGELLVSGSSFT